MDYKTIVGMLTACIDSGRLSSDEIESGARQQMFGTENTGHCINCGSEHDCCEPDAKEYVCSECGQCAVFGDAELMFYL